MEIYYKVLFACFLLSIVWILIYIFRKDLRKELWWSSIICAPLGFFEPVWFMYYWDPRPTLFDLTTKIGFDIESILLMFLIGGISGSLYEVLFHRRLKLSNTVDVKLNYLVLVFLVTYVISQFILQINAIYSTYIGVFSCLIVIAIIYTKYLKIFLYSGLAFLVIYGGLFILFGIFFPGYIEQVYSTAQISGIKIFSVPLEEYLFALFFGGMWAILYPLYKGYRLAKE